MEETNERKYCVYMHRNKINNKVYIGQTGTSVEDRWQNGKGYKGCTLFERAIEKYGWDNFEHIILKDNLTRQEVGEVENKFITLYDSTNPEKGYNISVGGESGHVGVKMSAESREKMSKARKGKSFSQEHKGKISAALQGRVISQEAIDKMRFAKGEPFVQLDLDGCFIQKYNTTWEASQQTGISQSAIAGALSQNKQKKTAGGFIWIKSDKYYEPSFLLNLDNNIRKYANNHQKAVVQLNKNGEYIARFDSCASAQRAIDKTGKVINACCRGDVMTAYGYIWVYESEYNPKKDYSMHKSPTWNQYAVIQMDKQFNVIAEFSSVNEAHKQTNINVSCICECCNGMQKTAGDFLWLKKEDYDAIQSNQYNMQDMYSKIKKNNIDDAETHVCNYDGVTWNKGRKKWEAKITINGKPKLIGKFDNMQDAINARKLAEIEKKIQESDNEYKTQTNNKSGCAGVCLDKRHNKWMATLVWNKKTHYLGRFVDKDEAIKVRLNKEIEIFGYDNAPQRHLFEQYGITQQNEIEDIERIKIEE